MGFFSWTTSDTNKSISNKFSGRKPFTVYMITEDGRCWKEENYEGYGEFGGKDIYELIAELNGKKTRTEGIDLIFFKENQLGDFGIAVKQHKIFCPKLVEDKTINFHKISYPKRCNAQGFFY